MVSELDGFGRGVFEVHRDGWEEMLAGMGLKGISPGTIERRGFNDQSYKWMHSWQRGAMGRMLALGALSVYGLRARKAEMELAAYWHDTGRVPIPMGFLTDRGVNFFKVPKFRTMRPGSEHEALGHGQSSLFGPEAIIARGDKRVVGELPARVRRQRLDELPQLWEALMGRMWLVGPRLSVVKDELRDEIILYGNRFDPRMVNLRWVVEAAAEAMRLYSPKGGIFSPLSSYLSKLTPFDVRKLGDWAFLNCCSPWVDSWVIISTIKRMRSGKGVQ